jgi:hypothetical protein
LQTKRCVTNKKVLLQTKKCAACFGFFGRVARIAQRAIRAVPRMLDCRCPDCARNAGAVRCHFARRSAQLGHSAIQAPAAETIHSLVIASEAKQSSAAPPCWIASSLRSSQ